MTPIAFVACVESGPLEQKARLLVRSLRRFGGAHRDAPIHTFAPRAGLGISDATRELFAGYGVAHHDEIFHADFAGYGVGNKLIGAALDHIQTLGLPIRVRCPVVREFIARNPQYAPLIDQS